MKSLNVFIFLFFTITFMGCNAEQTPSKQVDKTKQETPAGGKTLAQAEPATTATSGETEAQDEANPQATNTTETTEAREINIEKQPTVKSASSAPKPTANKTQLSIPDKKTAADKSVPIRIDTRTTPATSMDKPQSEGTITITQPTAKVAVKEKPATTATPKPEPVKTVKQEVPTKKPEPQLSHEDWDKLLRKHVSASGNVDYAGFKADGKSLDAYLALLDKFPVQKSWGKAKTMAYWINAYNAFTVKMIVKNYPVGSIMDLHGGKPWDHKWIKLGGQAYSLNNIENDILRPTYKDARIHFAVNCAAKSCPPLLNRAWTANNLLANFDQQAKAFINNSKYNSIGKKEIKISKIFEWYAGDFGNSIVDYINKYANTKVDAGAKVGYMEYDWKLNERIGN